MRRRLINKWPGPLWPVIVVSVAALVVATEQRSHAQRPPAATVKVRSMPYLTFSVFQLAQQEGLFAQQGLTVELIDMDSSAPVIPALARGDLDVLPAVMSPALFNAIVRGAEIRMVAAASELIQGGCTTTAIVANHSIAASGRLARADGWKNLRIAGSRAPFSGFLLDKVLRPIGVHEDQLAHVDVPDQIEAETIRAGRADVGVMSEPWLTRALAANDVTVWRPMQDVAPGFQYTVVLYGPTLLKTHRDVGQRFMSAYLEAIRRFDQGKTPRNLEVVASATGLDRDLLSRTCWPTVRANAAVNTAGALEFQAWAADRGLVDRQLPLASFYDPSFSDTVRQAAGLLR
jgi:NitT/TauT family transport system substrate-binding protein